MFADLRAWPLRRRAIAIAVAVVAFAAVVAVAGLASPLIAPVPMAGPAGSPGIAWLSLAAAAVAAGLAGLVVASYAGTPIGADATLCDTRWPVLGLVAMTLATDIRSAEPLLTGAVRPVVALAAVALLAWALRERLASERRATEPASGDAATADGEACTTCRPLFTRTEVTSAAASAKSQPNPAPLA